MKKLYLALFLSIVSMSVTAKAEEQTTEFKIYAKQEEGNMAEYVKSANEACGSNINFSFDWNSFSKMDKDAFSPSGYCTHVSSSIISLCSSNDAYKASVAKNIKEIHCSLGTARAIELSNGTVNFTIDPKASNDEEAITKVLNSKL